LEDNGARTHPARIQEKSKTDATIVGGDSERGICVESPDLTGKTDCAGSMGNSDYIQNFVCGLQFFVDEADPQGLIANPAA
jgi:hypothetical protein